MNAMTNASKKILIADDDASIRLVLSQAFTRLGYQVRATGNASTLLKWVSDGEGDLEICIRVVDLPGNCPAVRTIPAFRAAAT